jgi:hypothetical protein
VPDGDSEVRRLVRWACVAALVVGAAPAPALETDQFYAWARPLRDATDAINAKINADIAAALLDVNTRLGADDCTCERVQKAIRHRFSYLIFQKPEVWATNTSLLERIPSTPEEELSFRHDYLYGASSPLDAIRFMPPSPTILVDGVRLGTDKLGHFFSVGAWMFISYRYYMQNGRTEDEAVARALALGLASERTILGSMASGVMSLADIEANHKGLLFWKSLCDGKDPVLEKTPSGWRLKRPFDLAAYVTPEWDESWQPNVYTSSRWKKVKPVMETYCALLQSPEIQAQRASYAARDRHTLSEGVLHGLVAHGKLADPTPFTIDAVCGLPSRDVLAPPPVAAGDDAGSTGVPGEQVGPGEN